jgi:hypothetical protein
VAIAEDELELMNRQLAAQGRDDPTNRMLTTSGNYLATRLP